MITRRQLLVGSAAAGVSACAPAIRAKTPHITHGVQAGDVQTDRAIIWARCDEPARMVVEWSTVRGFGTAQRVAGNVVGPDTDHTGTVTLANLPAGQTIVYRVRFEREAARGTSAWSYGRFAMPRSDRFRFVWTGDTCGQGFGRNPEWGGLLGYAAMRRAEPAFFLHSGDLIYADNPILAEKKLADGRIWKNITNDKVGKVAETLDEFRARFAYNYEDEHVRALAAEVPIVAQWDDHETHNNWWHGQRLDDERYKDPDATKLATHALRATREWMPIGGPTINRVIRYGPLLDVITVDLRTFRSPNDTNRGDAATMLGISQARWLVDALSSSRARWRIVACDQPIALVIGDGPDGSRHEGYANGDGGPPLGREKELAGVLAELAARNVGNTVWLTADVHYAAAHRFDPARAAGVTFVPFWEFVAGPIHAGTFGPEVLDPTFGPSVEFQWAPPPGTGNLAPWDGLQSFGSVDVSADTLHVSLVGIDGKSRYAVDITR
ncbi:MAG: alkaline phosphatase D family protein [Deltaproteobacteria bacterium]|nr:alkaline phosphatase D family protein [Deltaproteobacteria bacterium]